MTEPPERPATGGGRRAGTGRGFDRIRPPEDRLATRPVDEDTDRAGRAALFSSAPRPQSRRSGLAVHCTRCGRTSPVDAATALRSVLPVALVVPWKDHPVFAICPAGGHRAWLRPTRQR